MIPQSILIADDDRGLVELLAIRCRHLGLDVRTAFDSLSAIVAFNDSPPDLVCLDVNMPGIDGLSVGSVLASMPSWVSIPVIVLTGREDPQTIKRCHDLCAYYVLKCNDVWPRLEPLIQELLDLDSSKVESDVVPGERPAAEPKSVSSKGREPSRNVGNAAPRRRRSVPSTAAMRRRVSDSPFKQTLLVIDDDPAVARTINLFLGEAGVIVRHCAGVEDALSQSPQADAILCDMYLSAIRGTFLVRHLRRICRRLPVIMLSADRSTNNMLDAMNAGCDGFLVKPFCQTELLEVLGRHTALKLPTVPCSQRP